EEKGRRTFAVPRQVAVPEDAPAVVEADVHPALELETIADAETVKGPVPPEMLPAPDIAEPEPTHDAVPAVDSLSQFDLRLHHPLVAVTPFVITAHALHTAQLGIHVPR